MPCHGPCRPLENNPSLATARRDRNEIDMDDDDDDGDDDEDDNEMRRDRDVFNAIDQRWVVVVLDVM